MSSWSMGAGRRKLLLVRCSPSHTHVSRSELRLLSKGQPPRDSLTRDSFTEAAPPEAAPPEAACSELGPGSLQLVGGRGVGVQHMKQGGEGLLGKEGSGLGGTGGTGSVSHMAPFTWPSPRPLRIISRKQVECVCVWGGVFGGKG